MKARKLEVLGRVGRQTKAETLQPDKTLFFPDSTSHLHVRASVARLPDSPINVACPPHLHSISSVKGDQTSAAADSLLFLESIKALDLVIDRKRSYHIAVSELVSPKMGIVRSGYGYFRSSHVVLYLE
ncbi:hypothetical protein F2P81_008767 [Scophthalmus maximus]|uniref:Uncharacterized protein n=1 Tax=Scophthalmus maximus TaxID=52904 RepID=A0A6A4SWL8_SCOMX|nr:hypothetical protein F2P81_008767 [Scophthalmus maximus]